MNSALTTVKKPKKIALYTPCLSIYLPTQKKLNPNFKTRDRIKLMRIVTKIEKHLFSNSIDPNLIKKILKPLKEMVEDQKFWISQQESLVIFVAEDFFEYYKLDSKTELAAFIDSEFNMKPLAKMMENTTDTVLVESTPTVVTPFEYTQKIA